MKSRPKSCILMNTLRDGAMISPDVVTACNRHRFRLVIVAVPGLQSPSFRPAIAISGHAGAISASNHRHSGMFLAGIRIARPHTGPCRYDETWHKESAPGREGPIGRI